MKAIKLFIIVLFIGAVQLFSQFTGTALEFDGVDEYVNCGNDASLNITNAITIEAWINANSWGANIWEGTIVGKDDTDKTGYNLRCGENGRLSFVNGIAGAWPEVQSAQIMSTNEWCHVAGVYDGSSQKIYINGELVGENLTTGTIGVNTLDVYIGADPGYAGRLFDGKIDEVRIWSVARTETEIQDNMYNSLLGTEPGLVAYYELDEGTGILAGDSAGSNDGTLTNMEEADWVGSDVPLSPSIVLLSNPILFTLVTENFNSIDAGGYSSPTFTDLDGDGLLDMLIGDFNGNIDYYEQDSNNSLTFVLRTENFNGIDVGVESIPTFTDIDGNGLLDMLIGEADGNINHYEQDAVNSTAFTLVTENFNEINVGSWAAPTFTDLDGDGLLDMIIGENIGNLNHYKQNTSNSTSFTLVTNSFNSIDVGQGSKPTFTDLYGDGLLDMIIGDFDGKIDHYEQISPNSTLFTLVTETFNGIDIGSVSDPTFTDLDGNGLPDMIIGDPQGNLNHYEQKDDISEINFNSVLVGNFSVENYIVKTSNLTSDLNVDCTGDGYLISLSESSGYQKKLSITPVDGTVSGSIFVRFEPTLEQEYLGNISHTSQNMETKNIALNGFGSVIDGIPGTALEFDGTDDYVETTLNDLSGSAITIEYWFKGSDIQSAVRQQNGDYIVAGWNDLHILSNDGGTNGIPVGAGAEDGNWHHIAMTWQQNTINGFVSYLDGNIVGQRNSSDTPLPSINANVLFGSYNGTGEFMTGSLEEVRIWNIARTASEIRESINLPLTGSETGLVGLWQFNEGVGTTTSNIGDTGTLTNMEEADWVNSTIPFGLGTVNTQIVNTIGLVYFTGTDILMEITEKTGIDTIVVTKIKLAPNIIPSDVDEVFDSQYWVIRKYGTGTYNSNTTFKINEDLTIEDENKPNTICLFTRDVGADDNWYFEVRSGSVDSSNEQSIFNVANDAGQYILARSEKPLIKEVYPEDDQIAVLLDENLAIKFDMLITAGAGNITLNLSSNDSIVETITASSTFISDSLVTIDLNNDLELGTDYYVFIDSTAFLNVDSAYFGGIYEKETWSFRSLEYFTDISTGLVGVQNSSVAWGDYDNDGDLDILLTGDSGPDLVSKIYQNNSGAFTDINAGLQKVYNGSSCWGDYDNDGDLDILLTGYYADITKDTKTDYPATSIIYRNDGNNTFIDINAGLEGVDKSSVAWGDYDNDGDLDILLTGYTDSGYISKIYQNNLGVFTDINAGLQGVKEGSVAWGDYDNDGDLDILLTGYTLSGIISKIYRNDSGVFTEISTGLEGVCFSSVAWGDYDNDGDLDILLSGNRYGEDKYKEDPTTSRIYRNDSGVFIDINAGLRGVDNGSVAWGDYDNDGDLDILLTGYSQVGRVSKIYRNDSGSSFTDINTGLTGVYRSSTVWGDYDNDGNLDILLTGNIAVSPWRISKICRNNSSVSNTVPTSPINLSSSSTDSTITFSWDKATDNETPQDGLSYNLYLGTVDNKDSINSSMSDNSNGYRKVVSLGNANQNNSWVINNLPGGEYYWSIQAIDHAFTGSQFSAEQSFTILTLGVPQNVIPDVNGNDIHLSWDAVPDATSYKIFASTDPYGTFTDFTNFGTLNGSSWDISWSGDKLFFYVIAVSGTKVITKSIKSNKTVIKSK